jgi:hypothetical protein
VDRLIAEAAGDRSDVVVLKEANPGDSRGTSLEAGGSVVEGNTAQSEHWDAMLAGLMEGIEA